MSEAAVWEILNRDSLVASLAEVREALERHAAKPAPAARQNERNVPRKSFPRSSLDRLCEIFALGPFERDILVLCAGMELDAAFAPLCGAAQGASNCPYPTFSLALAALREPHWSALSPAAPLRRWHLVEIGPGSSLTTSPLRIDECILHYLTGACDVDERLAPLVEAVPPTARLAPSGAAVAEQMAELWARSELTPLPVLELCGPPEGEKREIAAAACARLGMALIAIRSQILPSGAGDLNTLIRLLARESALHESALLLDCEDADPANVSHELSIARLIETLGSPLIVASRVRRSERRRPMICFDAPKPTVAEQRALWEAALGAAAPGLNGHVEALAAHFNLSATAIQAACSRTLGEAGTTPAARDFPPALWDSCRVHARARLDDVAQRLEPAAGWDDLILPESQTRVLREIAIHVRHRHQVYGEWGFAEKNTRGLGISALFAGQSGTGKTMAAEVLASDLRLDLFCIDLSSVVSKYIGETEKNLRRVFDAAEEGGAILLFDEADALFGKRSEVKDSHDRYANIEVSYLLQRMDAYRGLAILTTNRKEALDSAFLRRLRFIVHFPFPDAAGRAEIWRRIFPQRTPTEGLDPARLARLNVAGGNIRNIALNAAFLAAEAGEPVRMSHVLRAAQSEYAKLEKPLSEVEAGGWS
jgi:hypothetical protein